MKPLLLALFLLTACKETEVTPLPVALTADSTGYFCQMNLLEHPGPKAQIHTKTFPGHPLFFSQVKDAVAYLQMPEQPDTVTAIYVSDMGAVGTSWADPGVNNWIAAESAVYVIGSNAKGGMDAPEFVPFADAKLAADFAKTNGGQIFTLADIPKDAITPPAPAQTDDADIAERLNALTKTGG